MEDIRVVDGHTFVADNFDGRLLNVGAAQVLNHCLVDIFAVQREREVQPRGPGDSHIVFVKVGDRSSSCWFWSMLLGLLVMTKECRTLLTPNGRRAT
ncbi:MAG: hypothetical protein AB2661_10405, partial [Candidatus Thiodiazotropha sp.]